MKVAHWGGGLYRNDGSMVTKALFRSAHSDAKSSVRPGGEREVIGLKLDISGVISRSACTDAIFLSRSRSDCGGVTAPSLSPDL